MGLYFRKLIPKIFFLSSCLTCLGQDDISLINAISKIEKKFNISFSYTNKFIKKQVKPPSKESLEENLRNLEQQTLLKFESISQGQYIIRPFKNSDLISVCGYAKKRNSNVKSLSIISKSGLQTTTNDEGYFEFKKIGFYDIILFYESGLLSKQLLAKDLFKIYCPTIEFSNKAFVLDEVTIKSYIADGIEKEKQKTIISPANFKVLSGLTEPDVLKTIQQIPNTSSPFETASQIFVRGSTPDQNLILWNGIKTYNQGHFFGLISTFNPYIIDTVNFYNKGISSNYGGRLASVIELQSDKNIASKFSGNIGTNLLHLDVSSKIPLIKDKLSLNLSARRSFSDLWESPTYKSFSERVFQNTKINNSENGNNQFVFSDYSFSINYQPIKKLHLQLNGIYTDNSLNFDSENTTQQFEDNLITNNSGYNAILSYDLNKKIKWKSSIGQSNYFLDYKFDSFDKNTTILKSSSKKNLINDSFIQSEINWKFNTNQKLNFGISYGNNIVQYEFLDIEPSLVLVLDQQKDTLISKSIFGGYEYNNPKKFFAQLGFRLNDYSTDNGLLFEPRIFIQKNITRHLSVNTSFTLLSQALTQVNESVVSSLSLENTVWRVSGGDDFDVLKSNQFSIGSIYKRRNWLIEVDTFLKNTKNVTTITSGFISNLSSAFSTGEQKTRGADLFIKKQFDNYSSWLSFAYLNQQTRFQDVNNNQFFLSNLNIDYSLNWSHFYEYKNWNFSASWLWHTGKSVTTQDNIITSGSPLQLSFNQLNTGNLPVYHRLDTSILYTFKQKPSSRLNYKLGASIQNIYNRKSTINREFRASPGLNNQLLVVDYSSLGITPNLSFRIVW